MQENAANQKNYVVLVLADLITNVHFKNIGQSDRQTTMNFHCIRSSIICLLLFTYCE